MFHTLVPTLVPLSNEWEWWLWITVQVCMQVDPSPMFTREALQSLPLCAEALPSGPSAASHWEFELKVKGDSSIGCPADCYHCSDSWQYDCHNGRWVNDIPYEKNWCGGSTSKHGLIAQYLRYFMCIDVLKATTENNLDSHIAMLRNMCFVFFTLLSHKAVGGFKAIFSIHSCFLTCMQCISAWKSEGLLSINIDIDISLLLPNQHSCTHSLSERITVIHLAENVGYISKNLSNHRVPVQLLHPPKTKTKKKQKPVQYRCTGF